MTAVCVSGDGYGIRAASWTALINIGFFAVAPEELEFRKPARCHFALEVEARLALAHPKQVAFWYALRHAGVNASVSAYGRLFRTLGSENLIDDQIELYSQC